MSVPGKRRTDSRLGGLSITAANAFKKFRPDGQC
jgi:hypothetical protein